MMTVLLFLFLVFENQGDGNERTVPNILEFQRILKVGMIWLSAEM